MSQNINNNNDNNKKTNSIHFKSLTLKTPDGCCQQGLWDKRAEKQHNGNVQITQKQSVRL